MRQIQHHPLEVGPEAEALVQEEGVDRISPYYMRHWLRGVRKAATRERLRKQSQTSNNLRRIAEAHRRSQHRSTNRHPWCQQSITSYMAPSSSLRLATIPESTQAPLSARASCSSPHYEHFFHPFTTLHPFPPGGTRHSPTTAVRMIESPVLALCA